VRDVALALVMLAACKSDPPPGNVETGTAPALAEEKASEPTRALKTTGTVRVLSADAQKLARPTTVAVRGGQAWISIGQLSALFTEGMKPSLPFRALAMPLEGGELGAEAVELPGPDYHPEGIAAASDGTLYIGSIMQGQIMKVPADSTKAQPFLPKGIARRGVIGLTVDEPRKLLWFCDSNPKLDDAHKAGDLVAVQLADATEVVRHPLPKAGNAAPFCNDVIVSPDGAVWVTDSAGGRVFRISNEDATQAGAAAVWLAGGEIAPPPTGGSGANGLEWVDGHLVIANVGRGTLVEVDPASTEPGRHAEVITLTDEITKQPVTLCSPDGVERVPGSARDVLVVENGGCATKTPRVVKVTLSFASPR
jgi:sugar lactone lactonase YvrE